jgi:hypothetical protein
MMKLLKCTARIGRSASAGLAFFFFFYGGSSSSVSAAAFSSGATS